VYERLASLATTSDAAVPCAENTLGVELLAACWNARSFHSRDLTTRRGQVSAEALEAIRETELVGIVPHAPVRFGAWRGTPVTADDDPRIDFELGQLRHWNAIEERALRSGIAVAHDSGRPA